jgi:hypothetical protein
MKQALLMKINSVNLFDGQPLFLLVVRKMIISISGEV